MLLELEGYEVVTASNGQEALRMLTNIDQPCLIVLDLMMPVMNGWEFLDALNTGNAPEAAHAPIIVVSAAADSVDLPLRKHPVLRKPFNIESLLTEVRQHCSAN
jgi:CheY-like chemotaxis protein